MEVYLRLDTEILHVFAVARLDLGMLDPKAELSWRLVPLSPVNSVVDFIDGESRQTLQLLRIVSSLLGSVIEPIRFQNALMLTPLSLSTNFQAL